VTSQCSCEAFTRKVSRVPILLAHTNTTYICIEGVSIMGTSFCRALSLFLQSCERQYQEIYQVDVLASSLGLRSQFDHVTPCGSTLPRSRPHTPRRLLVRYETTFPNAPSRII